MIGYRRLWDEDTDKIHIISNALTLAPVEAIDEIKQHVTVKRDGSVRIERFAYREGCKPYPKIEDTCFSIPIEAMEKVFNYIGYYLQTEHEYVFVTDVGHWEINLISQNESSMPFTGPLFTNEIRYYEGQNICDVIRDLLGISDLYLFDGNIDRLDVLTINYERERRSYFRDEGWDFSKGEPFHSEYHKEQLKLLRHTNQLIYTIWYSEGCKTQQILEMNKTVLDILNTMEFDAFVNKQQAVLVNEAIQDKLQINYRIETKSKNGIHYICEDSFDRYHLPLDWSEFVELCVENLEKYISFGEMFQKKYYDREVRLVSDYRFALIKFAEHGQTYTYLCENEEINVGDWVLVPVGTYGHTNKGKVIAIEYHQAEKAPYPMSKIKSVIKRLDLEDTYDFKD